MRRILKVAPGLYSDDTSLRAAGRYIDANNVRFRLGLPQVIGGWESLMSETLSGVCRAAFPWTDNDGVLNMAFGTHSALQVWQGGELFTITPADLAAGQIDGTGTIGYGTGAYGIGAWNEPSDTEYYPRTWSLAAWGENLLASPRNGTIYAWANDTGTEAAALSNAPDNITQMLVAHTRQVFALGCNEEVSGDFNPLCIRHSSVENNNAWTTGAGTTSRGYILPGGGRIVGGLAIGEYLLIFTSQGVFLGTFVGALEQPWRFDPVGLNCGLAGPNAAVVRGSTAFWVSPDRQFWSYTLGGSPQAIPCPIREDFAEHLAFSQADKIVASTNAEYAEVWFHYPDRRDGYENSRYVALCVEGPDAGSWFRGEMPRTAFVDAGPSLYPCGVTYGGSVYWHERGPSADGAPLAWHIETADQYLSEDQTLMIRGVWPDVQDQMGPASLTLTTRFKPQGDERTYGPYEMAVGVDKVDLRATGRLVRLKFSGSSSPAAFRLGSPVLDLAGAGKR